MKFKKYMIIAMMALTVLIASCQNETPVPEIPEQQAPDENGELGIKIDSDAPCTWYLDGKDMGGTENGSISLTGLRPGTHAVSVTSGDITRVRIFTVGEEIEENGTTLFIDFTSERKEAGVLSATTLEGHLDKSDLYMPENLAMTNIILWSDGTATRKSPFGGDTRELAWKFDGDLAILADSTGRLYWGTRADGHVDMEIVKGWSYDIARHYRESVGSDIGIYGKWLLPSTAFTVLLPEALLGFINDFLSGVDFDIELDIGRELGGISLSAALCVDLSNAELTEVPLSMLDHTYLDIPEMKSGARVVIEMLDPIVLPPEKLAAFTAELSSDRRYMKVSFPFTGPEDKVRNAEFMLLRKLPYESLRSWSDGADLGRARYFKEDHEINFEDILRALLKTKLSEDYLLEDYMITQDDFLDKRDPILGSMTEVIWNDEANSLIGRWDVHNITTDNHMTWLFDGRMAFTENNAPHGGSNAVWEWYTPMHNASDRLKPNIIPLAYTLEGDEQTMPDRICAYMFTDNVLPEEQTDGSYKWSLTKLTDQVDSNLDPIPSTESPIEFIAVRQPDSDKAEIIIDRYAVQQGVYFRLLKTELGKDGYIMHPITKRSEKPDEFCRFDDQKTGEKLGIQKPCGYVPFSDLLTEYVHYSNILPECFSFTRSTYGVTPTEFGVLLETAPGAKIPLAWPDGTGTVPEGTEMLELPGLRISLIMPFRHEETTAEYHEWIVPYSSSGKAVEIPLHDLGKVIN